MTRFLGTYLSVLFLLPAFMLAAEQPRVYVSDSRSWEMRGAVGGRHVFGGATSGGDRPQTAEIIKTFGQRCPGIIINNVREKADYIVLLDHEGGKDGLRRDNKVVVFNHEGDAILSDSTRILGNAVKDACSAITSDWSRRPRLDASASSAPLASGEAAASVTRVQIDSNPSGADIHVDGNFVGHTPSTLNLASGEHQVIVRKPGYTTWSRSLRITGGMVSLNPELEPEDKMAQKQ